MYKKGVIFDLDGTLWDSVAQIVPAWNATFEKYGIDRRLTEAEARSLMGKTASEIASALMPTLPEEHREDILKECCFAEYRVLSDVGGVLYPNLADTLTALSQKYALFIVSNCLDGYIQTFLEHHKLGDFFADIECAGRTGKSKGENISLVINRNKLDKAIYVGDTVGDYTAAQSADVPFVWASYGFGDVGNAKYRIDRFCDIIAMADELLSE